MINIAKPLAVALLTTFISSATAQEIKKEVEIRYQEAPELRDMTKLSVDPTISLPVQKQTSLPYSTSMVDITVPPSISTLEPAPYADTIYTSPYRGYAALGFMPRFNLAASAGYKFLDTDRTRLDGWLQYDGTAYRGVSGHTALTPEEGISPLTSHIIRRNTATVGINLHQAAGKESFVDFGADYTFARFNNRLVDRWANQNINRLNLSGLWIMAHGKMSYGIGAAFSRFAPTNSWGYTCLDGDLTSSSQQPAEHQAPATRESRYDFAGFISAGLTANSSFAFNVQYSHQGYNHNGTPFIELPAMLEHLATPDHSTLRIAPAYRLHKGQIDLNLGLNLDLTFNQGKTVHIAPAAQATWTPGDIVKVYIKANGGQHLNTLSSLYERSPYTVPFGAWRNSQVALDAEVGVTVGSWKGFFAELSVSYARANDWLMAINTTDHATGLSNLATTYAPVDMMGYKLHAALGYNFRNIVSLKGSIDMAPQDYDRGYYQWADRAKMVANVDLTIHPIKNLDLNLGWEYRGKRAVSYLERYTVIPDAAPIYITATDLSSLGSVSNLKAGALYHISDRWSVFLTGDNLLGHDYYLIGNIPGQGRTGLAGVTYKF